MRHAVIMAGGSGTRLWPLSRRLRPKQLLNLFDGQSLLQLARARLAGLFDAERIWVITSANYLGQVAAALPDVPRANLIGEPVGRDTANAVGLAAKLLALRDPDATMAVFTADHLIQPAERFAAAIRAGLEAAEQNPAALVTFGITPRSPHTGYGYVRRAARIALRGAEVSAAGASAAATSAVGEAAAWQRVPVYEVAAFKEKPKREVAEEYVRSGEYYWNSGLFAWRVSAILDELARHLPDNARALTRIAAHWPQPDAAAEFGTLHKISIDFGVMEKDARVLVAEMDVDWHDLGSFTAIAATQTPDPRGNVALAPRRLVVDAQNNTVVSETEHLIVLLGVSDLVVVHSGDATLVCRQDQVERIKDLVAPRTQQFGEQYE
jgi:mannose-1-phosphate guanylyltransferase